MLYSAAYYSYKVVEVVQKDKTKNASSRRTLPLVPDVCEKLLALQVSEQKNRRSIGGLIRKRKNPQSLTASRIFRGRSVEI